MGLGPLSTFFVCADFRGRGRLSFGWGGEGRDEACPYGSV